MKVTCTYDFEIPDGMVQAAVDKKIGEMIGERDFEEVVRCENCKNFTGMYDEAGTCRIHHYQDGLFKVVIGKDFCSRGEEKTDDKENL